MSSNVDDMCFESGTQHSCGAGRFEWIFSTCNNQGYGIEFKRWDGASNPYYGQFEAELKRDACSRGDWNNCIRRDFGPGTVSQWFPNYGGEGAHFWVNVTGGPPPPPPPPVYDTSCPAAAGSGEYFPQTQFWVRNGTAGANFLTEFNRFGRLDRLGYPVSRVYWKEGFYYQAFQRAILQWRPEGQAVLANTMDWLYQAGYDDYLASLGFPRHFTGNDGCGGDFGCAMNVRSGWMTNSAIRDAVLAIADWVNYLGLPTSQPETSGPFIVQRFQRYVWQLWIDSVPGMPVSGSVVPALVGQMAKEAGLIPGCAMQAEAP